RLLEQVILPDLARRAELRRVLFVGCAWYTESYERFFPGREYWTLDLDPEQARFGARGGRHLVDSASRVAGHFAPASLDLIVLNGVYGWGLDARDDLEEAFGGFRACLRPGGLLLVGWNDVPEHTPVPLESIDALKPFAPWVFAPLGGARIPTDTELRHTFDFYQKPPD
ncbi:MAG TPA: class I SAM-dependent methyltransferase, partial [Armatimonadaceae bacterium]|nr:class I SAM-dependent methyltransferase [Armatimonadaceae bacterium]